MENRKILTAFRQILVFAAVFVAITALLASFWVKEHFFIQHFGQIIYHLRFPLLNSGEELPRSFATFCLPGAFLIAFLLVFLTQKKAKIQGFSAVLVIIFCAAVINSKLQIVDFFKAQSARSDLYEKHYRAFSLKEIPQNPKNLIIIFMESMTSAFTTDSIPNPPPPV